MVSSLASSLANPIVGFIVNPLARYFMTYNGTSSLGTLMTPHVATGDFAHRVTTVLPAAATTFTLFGQTASVANYIKVLSTGFMSISIDSSIVTSTVLATKDGNYHSYGVVLSGNDFLFQEDNVTIDTVTDAVAAAKTLTLNASGASNGADFYQGAMWGWRVSDASNTWTFPHIQATSSTEVANEGGNTITWTLLIDRERLVKQVNGDWDGANGLSVTPDQYHVAQLESIIDVGGVPGTHLIKSDGGGATGVQWNNISTVGKVYKASLNITEQNAGTLNIRDIVASVTGLGIHNEVITATGTSYYVKRQSGVTDITSKDHSLRRTLLAP